LCQVPDPGHDGVVLVMVVRLGDVEVHGVTLTTPIMARHAQKRLRERKVKEFMDAIEKQRQEVCVFVFLLISSVCV
jgi:cyclopropane fatty-acyl-phospholipid synthase-like methyltransferase